MLLHRLVEYTTNRPGSVPPFHRDRVYSWQLELSSGGGPARLSPLVEPDPNGRARGVVHATPSIVRTVGVAANLAADDVQYVLGWPDAETKPERVAKCHAAFVDLIEQWAASTEGREDPAAQVVASFYRSGGVSAMEPPEEFTAKQGVVIAVDGVAAYRSPSAAAFWTSEVARRKGGDNEGLCLVCGLVRPLLDTVPGKLARALVPGASNDAALVSVNERVFGYDLTTQLAATPLCLGCGEAFTAGLRDVLTTNSTWFSDQDSRMAWWITRPVPFDPMRVLDAPDPADVAQLLTAIRRGSAAAAVDEAVFCSLTVGGNVARVVVRDWLEMPLSGLIRNVGKWIEDHEVAPRRTGGRRHHGLFPLVLASGRWMRDTGRYAEIGRRGADRPADVQRDLHRAAIRGVPLPPALLVHLVHRIATDGRLDDARASLLRLHLTRHPAVRESEKPMPGLDKTNTNPAYVAGRTFAVLEQIQYDASGGKLNTTYADRYFAGAVTNPRAAVVAGRRDAAAWLRKLRRDRPGSAVNHEKELGALFDLVAPEEYGLPARTTVAQQAMFLIGYHHQRAAHFASIPPKKNDARGAAESDADETAEEISR